MAPFCLLLRSATDHDYISFESLLKAEALRYGDNVDNICPEEDAESFYDENRRMSIEVRFPLATTQESKFWI